jgi:hypothetical protein
MESGGSFRDREDAGRRLVEEAGPETVLTCDAVVRHIVEALDDAVCLLTTGARAAEGASE